jgi:hypothetical protein
VSENCNLHAIDILYGIWQQPVQRPDLFIGFTIITQVFSEGKYLASCEQVGAWLYAKQLTIGASLREFARGPAGCFDPLLKVFPEQFADGGYLVGPQPDPTWEVDGVKKTLVPTECDRLVNDQGTFVSVQYLEEWLKNQIR